MPSVPLGESLGRSEVPLFSLCSSPTLWTLGVPEGGRWEERQGAGLLLWLPGSGQDPQGPLWAVQLQVFPRELLALPLPALPKPTARQPDQTAASALQGPASEEPANPASRAEQEALGGRRTSLRAQGEGGDCEFGNCCEAGQTWPGGRGVEVTWLGAQGAFPGQHLLQKSSEDTFPPPTVVPDPPDHQGHSGTYTHTAFYYENFQTYRKFKDLSREQCYPLSRFLS